MEVPSSNSVYSFFKRVFTKTLRTEEKERKNSAEIELINNLDDYFNTTIREVMIPRTKMITADKSQSIRDVIHIIHQTGHSRIPVQEKKRDNIVGIIYAFDLFRYFDSPLDIPISQVMRKPFFASYSQQIHQLLTNFKKNRIHLAIVVDEHGGVDGLVTIEDVIEELVGDIPDEFNKDNDPTFKKIGDGLVLMDANFPLDQFNDLYNTKFQKEGIETIGGYICHRSGKIPGKKEKIMLEDIQVIVQESDEKQLVKLRITAPNSSKSP